MKSFLLACLLSFTVSEFSVAQNAPKKPAAPPAYDKSVPAPTHAGVRYGDHERHVLDFWKADSDQPTPVAFVIHGGGWTGGSKERLHRFADPNALLEAGISVVAMNYRYTSQAAAADIEPPVKAPLYDAARALQFVRSKAGEWNLDKQRIGAAGGSAGACSSLWLAFHDDLADPDSSDPVARESSRLWCAAVTGAQTTLDPQQMKTWTPNSRYGGHAFGRKNFTSFLKDRAKILPWIQEYSPYALVSKDDPPVYLIYSVKPALGENQKDPTHTSNFGVKLQEHCREIGTACELVYPGAPDAVHANPTAYLIDTLLSGRETAATGFKSLFNGKDLDGWDGDPELWKVENGIVVGTCDGPDHLEHNTFLIWRGGTVKDFELRATMRVVGDNNSGIQYRSRDRDDIGKWVISGYQCDVHPAIEHTGMTYEEKGRGIFGLNGKNVLLDPDGARWLLSEHDPVEVDVSEWQEYTVIARGNHLVHQINGKTTSELIDHHSDGRALEGLLAIQLHRGNANRVEIKELKMKTLSDGKILPFDPDKLPEGAEKIDPPRTSRPQGTGVAAPAAFPLLEKSVALAKAADLPDLQQVDFHVIKKWDKPADGYTFLHGVGLAFHKGKLYASIGHNQGNENTVTEEAQYRVSEDLGETWGPLQVIDAGKEENLAVSHGVFLSHQGKLWAFQGAYEGRMQKIHTRAYSLDEDSGTWTQHGVVLRDGFWPMNQPVKMDDGNWIMPGFAGGPYNGKRVFPAAVAISHGDDLTRWDFVSIPVSKGIERMWGESALFVDGTKVVNIARFGGKAVALAAVSTDHGRTWMPSQVSNLPMATSKPAAGILSTGQRYLVCTNTGDSGGKRSPLTITVSRPGENAFSKIFVIRRSRNEPHPGESADYVALSYPCATEHDGRLYVGYSNNGGRKGNLNSAELAVIEVSELALPAQP